MTDETVADTIRQRLGECSPAERKVARAMLADYPSAGFDTVARLAARAGVSGPTVVRFATRLGFSGFPDLQRGLRVEFPDATASGVTPVDEGADPSGTSRQDLSLRHWVSETANAMTRTVADLPRYDVDSAVDLLADRRRQVYVVGGSYRELLAGHLYDLLAAMRAGVHHLAGPPLQAAAGVADLTGRDVLVVFDFAPYEPAVTALARYATRRHAKVLLFTAASLSPAAAYAEVVLPSEASRRALAPTVALLEAVASGVLDALGSDGLARRDRTDRLAGELAG